MRKPGTGRRPAPQIRKDAEPSRSAKKRESIALQKLGEELAALDPAGRSELNLPEELVDALAGLDEIKDHEACRRQKQFIGKIMRSVDANAIAKALAARRSQKKQRPEWLVIARNHTELLLNVPERQLNRTIRRFLDFTIPGMLGERQPETFAQIRSLARKARNSATPAEARKATHELFDALRALLPA